MSVTLLTVSGEDILPSLPALADLRIRVFREFPYLYDGSAEYEREYLQAYARSPRSLFVLALDGQQVVGASTGIPLADGTDEFRAPFVAQGVDVRTIFYFGESVLLPAWRGQGLGVRFFAERERYAQALGGFRHTAFCAVDRPADHPLRPQDYRPLDAFWARRGYRRQPEIRCVYRWKDVGQDEVSDHVMTYWMKDWA